jgi:penicillin amidase
MKWIMRIIIGLLALLLVGVGFLYFKGKGTAPQYEGVIENTPVHENVNVYFDSTGVPHIQATNKEDLYFAFGYVHAQDRLFQMELLRRAGSGRLAEVIGAPMVKVDRIFHTLGMPEYAKASAARLRAQPESDTYKEVDAYLRGINFFIDYGKKTPPEYSVIGIPMTHFTIEDMYCITGAMSFSFSQAQKTEPIVDFISKKYGDSYLQDIALWHDENETLIPNYDNRSPKDTSDVMGLIGQALSDIEALLPYSPLEGSNAWVVGPEKTKSGKVLFCNDTHIGYLAPQTWYEAYLSCPEFELYGHFMAAVPFALVGRNSDLSWGLTMLLNDDMDFYQEKIVGDQVMYKGEMVPLTYRDVTIAVKDSSSVQLHIPVTPHGPVVNGAFEQMSADAPPVSICWTYTQVENQTVEAFRAMNNAHTMTDFEKQLSKIHAPGLSINYGDSVGNIAWWACAKLVKRPEHVNSWTMLDGASGADDWQGYYDFSENPRNINPVSGYIYSANDWPEFNTSNGTSSDSSYKYHWYPGYYKPQYRADRINELLSSSNNWDLESMKSVMTDITNPTDGDIMELFYHIVRDSINLREDDLYSQYDQLFQWTGEYDREMQSPTFYTKFLYHYLHKACGDELGEERFKLFLTTHQVQRAMDVLIRKKKSPWWDDVNTRDVKESRQDIIVSAYKQTIEELREQFGDNPKIWQWKKACRLEVKHPLGEVAMFRPIFNLGPEPVDGSNETIMQSGFYLNGEGEYKVFFGSQMRIMVDFAHCDSALNITPCGNSGHLFSKYYNDQYDRYCAKEFRIQRMKIDPATSEHYLVFRKAIPN